VSAAVGVVGERGQRRQLTRTHDARHTLDRLDLSLCGFHRARFVEELLQRPAGLRQGEAT